MNRSIYQNVQGRNISKSVFDLSYEKKFTCDMGQIIPVQVDEVVPGDYFKMGCQWVTRTTPLVAPILHEVDQFVYSFFVPYRLMWNEETRKALADLPEPVTENIGDWETFISKGVSGNDNSVPPTWIPTDTSVGSLWDYMGLPTDKDPAGAYPLDFIRRAYNFIYNEYFRDQNWIPEVSLLNEEVLNVAWEKDRLTSSLPWQQRGTAPAIPLSGLLPVQGIGVGADSTYTDITSRESDGTSPVYARAWAMSGIDSLRVKAEDTGSPHYPDINVDLAEGVSFTFNDLRELAQVQRWMELNARTGVRYTELIQAHFNVRNQDARLQRPEMIGGCQSGLIFSEVLQTSETTENSPQGNLAGHGIGAGNNYIGNYKVPEHGLIMTLMFVRPKSAYQDGINKQWLRDTVFDFYWPEFANLSEQAITNAEVCIVDGDSEHNQDIFGYQGRYNEMRSKDNIVCGNMRNLYDYWHFGRKFNPVSPPVLNEEFLTCIPRKDVFAVTDEDCLIINFGNVIKAFRPMPVMANPGFLDH